MTAASGFCTKGIKVPGHVLMVPLEARDAVTSAIETWARDNGYGVSKEEGASTTYGKGAGFLTAQKQMRITMIEQEGQLAVELAPHLRNFGTIGSVEAKFIAGLPARTGRKDRDALILALHGVVPQAQAQPMICCIPGAPIMVFILIMIAIAVVIGVISALAG